MVRGAEALAKRERVKNGRKKPTKKNKQLTGAWSTEAWPAKWILNGNVDISIAEATTVAAKTTTTVPPATATRRTATTATTTRATSGKKRANKRRQRHLATQSHSFPVAVYSLHTWSGRFTDHTKQLSDAIVRWKIRGENGENIGHILLFLFVFFLFFLSKRVLCYVLVSTVRFALISGSFYEYKFQKICCYFDTRFHNLAFRN